MKQKNSISSQDGKVIRIPGGRKLANEKTDSDSEGKRICDLDSDSAAGMLDKNIEVKI